MRGLLRFAGGMFALGSLCTCAPHHEVYLVGQVYDGATGARLTGYELSVTIRDQTIDAQVDESGRFFVHTLPVYQDYTVEIRAAGYRAFRSHNNGFNIPNAQADYAGDYSTTQNFYFDAYLFPTGLAAPAVTINVRKGSGPASGKIRIRPTSASSLADSPVEMPAGVGSQGSPVVNPWPGGPPSQGSGTRHPSRPASNPGLRKKVGSCREASSISTTSCRPSSSPWYR